MGDEGAKGIESSSSVACAGDTCRTHNCCGKCLPAASVCSSESARASSRNAAIERYEAKNELRESERRLPRFGWRSRSPIASVSKRGSPAMLPRDAAPCSRSLQATRKLGLDVHPLVLISHPPPPRVTSSPVSASGAGPGGGGRQAAQAPARNAEVGGRGPPARLVCHGLAAAQLQSLASVHRACVAAILSASSPSLEDWQVYRRAVRARTWAMELQ